ncbi:ABC transporter ATP-binding protein [Oricola sp.]|uniref:ABC transporter ATP-binding protein n=1 Tax=Oricola sp. TaxID=1979950 RepID=UPI003512D688
MDDAGEGPSSPLLDLIAMSRISLRNVTVDYPIYNSRSMSLRNNLIAIGTGGRISKETRGIVSVTALDEITLELEHGDRVGLAGHNGSGKSTLLRTMAGVFRPVKGQIRVEGRVSTVFGLGAGLVPELSGYENIVRMAMMLGSTRSEAEAIIEDVERFSELGNFLSVPVSTYSDGMRTRLSFGVATAAHPDILLVDEVFGAGDAEFQKRAERRMEEFIEKSSIFVLASHNSQLLERFCNRSIRLEHGKIIESEETA